MSAMLAAVFLAFPLVALSHFDGDDLQQGGASAQLRGAGRKLWDISAQESHIWGRCERWDAEVTGCEFHSNNKCSNYYSTGPADADLEITLGNLTAAKPGDEVHVQWWAPRASETTWNPLQSIDGCSVYWRMSRAYPKYDESDFNGGNVKVNEAGEATIRVKNPATYFVSTGWISAPHIHLRLCSSESFAHTTQDAIIFTDAGMELHGSGNDGGSDMTVVRSSNLSWTDLPGSGSVKTNRVAGVLRLRKSATSTTTPTQSGMMLDATTSMAPVQQGEEEEEEAAEAQNNSLIIDDAQNKMDLDALEFSPIYQCFMNDQFYDHFTTDCASSCPNETEVVQGQCVRPALVGENTTIDAVWVMKVRCDDACWEARKNVSLHYTRLAMSDQLNIPFQEVSRVSLTFEAVQHEGRRLEHDAAHRIATFQMLVVTQRLGQEEALSLAKGFMTDTANASDILGFPVEEVALTTMATDDSSWKNTSKGDTAMTMVMDNQNDPYQDAYEQNAPKAGVGNSIAGIPLGALPVEAVYAIAAAVVVLGFLTGLGLVYYRRKRARQLTNEEMTAAGTVIGSSNPGGVEDKLGYQNPTVDKLGYQNPDLTAEQKLEEKAKAPW